MQELEHDKKKRYAADATSLLAGRAMADDTKDERIRSTDQPSFTQQLDATETVGALAPDRLPPLPSGNRLVSRWLARAVRSAGRVL